MYLRLTTYAPSFDMLNNDSQFVIALKAVPPDCNVAGVSGEVNLPHDQLPGPAADVLVFVYA